MPKITKEAVEAFVKKQTTWFDWEDMGGGIFQWESRCNGDIEDALPGQMDLEEGRRLAKLLREQFPYIEASFEVVGEWVQVEVRL